MPAAAGGPKGLGLIPFDRYLVREWLPAMPRVALLGASIGAWRMAALAQADAADALSRLQHAYVHDHNCAANPSAAVTRSARTRARRSGRARPYGTTACRSPSWSRARADRSRVEAAAAISRAPRSPTPWRASISRDTSSGSSHAGGDSTLDQLHDASPRPRGDGASNLKDALTAYASIPIVSAPVSDIAGAPPREYWDGGMIDYHLLLPHSRYDGIVLYPHFVPHGTPGGLDKFLPW
ncbi:MAG TPA: hypothetical protein VFQ55_08750 [Casimicrobiaceae bacterium]|nr:hypothetical protein [Casimicrobiaceae bacterium]